VGLRDDGVKMLEPKFTKAPLTNPLPVMVRETRSPLPASARGGESLLMVSGQLQEAAVTPSDMTLLIAPCADALICAVPSDTPLTSPLASMVATAGSLEVQVNTTPLIANPC
jgi:hypothetical protein